MAETRLDKFLASDLLKNIRKQHGKGILAPASGTTVGRIPTGIFQLDYALGGGLPAGRISTVYGHKSTGKTSMLVRTLGNAQKMCANCWAGEQWDLETGEHLGDHVCKDFRDPIIAYLDVEGTFDTHWAELLGLDYSKLLLSVPDYAEQTLDMAEALARSSDVDIIVIDSLAFLTPRKEIEESSGKALQAEQARTLGRAVRKFVAAINYCGNTSGRRPTILFTNQIRMKLGVMFGNPETQPGGFAAGFASTVEVKTYGGTKYVMDDLTGKPKYTDFKFRVEKNKSSGAKMEGEYRLMLSDTTTKRMGDVYDEDFIVRMAKKTGLIEKSGNGWLCLGEKFAKGADIETRMLTDVVYKRKVGQALLQVLRAA